MVPRELTAVSASNEPNLSHHENNGGSKIESQRNDNYLIIVLLTQSEAGTTCGEMYAGWLGFYIFKIKNFYV